MAVERRPDGAYETLVPDELADDTGDLHFVPAPCQIACPVGTDAPSYIAYIWEGKFAEAFEAITVNDFAGERVLVGFFEAMHDALEEMGGDELTNRYFNLLSGCSPVSSTSSVCATTCGVPAFCARLCPGYLRASCATFGRSPTRTRTSTRS